MATSRPPASLAETKSIIRLLEKSCSDKQWDIICYWSLSPILIIGVTTVAGILNSANANQMENINDIVVYFPNHNVTNHNTSSCIAQAPSQYQVAWNPFNLVTICDYYNAMNVTQIDILKACTLACNATQLFKNEFILLALALPSDALLAIITLLTLQSVIFRRQIALAVKIDTIPHLEQFIKNYFGGSLNQLLPAKKITDTKIGDVLGAAKRRLWQLKPIKNTAPLTVVYEHTETKIDDFNDNDDIKKPDIDNNLDSDSDDDNDDKIETSFSFSSFSSLLCFSCFRHKKNPLSVRLLPVHSTHLSLSN